MAPISAPTPVAATYRATAADLHYIPGFLTAEEVSAVLAAVEQQALSRADITGLPDDPLAVIRRARTAILPPDSLLWLRERVHDLLATLNITYWGLDVTSLDEHLRYVDYGPSGDGPGLYAQHLDLVDARARPLARKVSFECGLGDEHSGGHLSVLNGPSAYQVKVMPGDLVAFPSYLPQEVLAVPRGLRRSLVGWMNGPAFR